MAQENQNCFNNGNIGSRRNEFLRKLCSFIKDYEGPAPDLREIFRPEAIEWLLAESVKSKSIDPKPLVDFMIKAGYKDEPKLDKLLQVRRTTPIHHATRKSIEHVMPDLFKIYCRFDVNWVDEDGYTHLHVACRFGCVDVAKKILDYGADPNCVATKTGHSPLHVALANDRREVARLLLTQGAEPNLRDKRRWTPLLLICRLRRDAGLAKMFLETCQEVGRKVQVDARDNEGLTALQLAVAHLSPDMTSVLLDNGAVLANFAFPTLNQFEVALRNKELDMYVPIDLPAGIMAVVEELEKKGYQLHRSDAWTVMNLMADQGLLGTHRKNLGEAAILYDDDEFADKAKEVLIKPGLSLYDFIGMRATWAARAVTYRDYYEFARAKKLNELAIKYREACALLICEVMCVGFFRRWTRLFTRDDNYSPANDSLFHLYSMARAAYVVSLNDSNYRGSLTKRPCLSDIDEISDRRFPRACRM